MKAYKIRYKPTGQFLSKDRGSSYYSLGAVGRLWLKNKPSKSSPWFQWLLRDDKYNIQDFELVEFEIVERSTQPLI